MWRIAGRLLLWLCDRLDRVRGRYDEHEHTQAELRWPH